MLIILKNYDLLWNICSNIASGLAPVLTNCITCTTTVYFTVMVLYCYTLLPEGSIYSESSIIHTLVVSGTLHSLVFTYFHKSAVLLLENVDLHSQQLLTLFTIWSTYPLATLSTCLYYVTLVLINYMWCICENISICHNRCLLISNSRQRHNITLS